ncbi:hypothetical protein KDH_48450 [Dictyobacter sp. S3.2.2.5]|uniref:Uncharacterized protein n=1 Tax=Dictyobacter halimunensis TaxID=3026934 RepID=A0ABQ6FZS3_9CHLR|nr:hypothetical protein KDH_48450 [Dictyobacter sp. S3.2.2.5]
MGITRPCGRPAALLHLPRERLGGSHSHTYGRRNAALLHFPLAGLGGSRTGLRIRGRSVFIR